MPGPRANLTLARAAADVADLADLDRWPAEPDRRENRKKKRMPA